MLENASKKSTAPMLSEENKQALAALIEAGVLDTYLNDSVQDKESSLAELFERDDKGNVKQSNENCQLVAAHDELLNGAVKYNELAGRMDVVKEMPWKRFTTSFADNDLDNIITYMEVNYGLKNKDQIERAVKVTAIENSYHPIRDKLNSLVWDGDSRLDKVLTKYLGVEPTPLAIESLKLFMLGAIARVFDPGCKFEYMLCFVGGQGAGKSTFLRFLAMDDMWFCDDIKKLNDKKVHESLNGHWIIEIPEMVAILHTKFVEETKAFLSRQWDNYRIPYDKFAADHPRQCVFAGTSNKIDFLPADKSGNRRFIPIKVNMENAKVHILENEAESRAYFEQLWAEVMEIYRSGNFKLSLSKEMQTELVRTQSGFMPEDPMETAIVNFIDEKQPKYVCAKMLFVEALGHTAFDCMEAWQSNAIGEIMNQTLKNEYAKLSSNRFNDYGTQRAWVRTAPPTEAEFVELTPEEEKMLPFR